MTVLTKLYYRIASYVNHGNSIELPHIYWNSKELPCKSWELNRIASCIVGTQKNCLICSVKLVELPHMSLELKRITSYCETQWIASYVVGTIELPLMLWELNGIALYVV